jgi:hypothetical protein
MSMTEHLLDSMAQSVNGSYITNWLGCEINLQGPYKHFHFQILIQKLLLKNKDN